MLLSSNRSCVALALLLTGLAPPGCGQAQAPLPEIEPPDLADPPFAISRATTYLTEPLRDDGYVDYAAATNEQMSQGVTVDNNAAVLLLEACGPDLMDAKYQQQYFELLGIPVLPAEGAYLQAFADYAKGLAAAGEEAAEHADWKGKPDDQLVAATARPWNAEEFPLLARWLKDGQKPLELAVAASERPKFYSPALGGDETLNATPLPATRAGRRAAQALVARAMQSADRGDFDAAWSDLLASHRLARLVARGLGIVNSLVATGIERMACTADHALAAELSDPERIGKMLDDLNRLPPLPPFADQIDGFDRLAYLDMVRGVAQAGPQLLTGERILAQGAPEDWLANSYSIDWDVLLRQGNEWYDRIAAMHRLPTRAERAKVAAELAKEMNALPGPTNTSAFLGQVAGGLIARDDASEQLAIVLISLYAPAFSASTGIETSAAVSLDLARLSLALAGYRARHGKYPSELKDLSPEWLPKLPLDGFSDEAFHYQPSDDGYLLYSIGANGNDDGGASADAEHQQADDLAIRRNAATP